MPCSFSEKYLWTLHARVKMKYYGVAESRVKRIIRFPARYEEGIAPKTVAVMCPYGTSPAGRQPYRGEIWVMYKLVKSPHSKQKKIKIITVWRYPGKAPTRDPIPENVLEEIKRFL